MSAFSIWKYLPAAPGSDADESCEWTKTVKLQAVKLKQFKRWAKTLEGAYSPPVAKL